MFIVLLILISVVFWCCIAKKDGRILDQSEEDHWYCAFYVNSDVCIGFKIDCRMSEPLFRSVLVSATRLTWGIHAVFLLWC